MSDKEEIGLKTEEENNEEVSIQEKEVTRNEMVDRMFNFLIDEYPNDKFTFKNLDDIKYDLIEVVADETIAFRQIIDMSFTVEKNQERIKGSYERNLRSFEKQGKDLKEKHNQEIAYMDQAEVTSVRTIKDAE